MVCKTFLVTGRVQGVYFRVHTQKKATELGLKGWVRNLESGQVEVLACGNPQAMQELETWLHEGPSRARVEQLQSKSWNDFPQNEIFQVTETGEPKCW